MHMQCAQRSWAAAGRGRECAQALGTGANPLLRLRPTACRAATACASGGATATASAAGEAQATAVADAATFTYSQEHSEGLGMPVACST